MSIVGRIVDKFQRIIRSVAYVLRRDQLLYPRRKSGDIIVMYHNIFPQADNKMNPRNIGIRDFEKQLLYFQRRFKIVSLKEMLETRSDERRLAITFDDGLINNLRYAAPMLTRMKIPATFFVCSPFLRGSNVLWPDRLSMLGKYPRIAIMLDGDRYMRDSNSQYWNRENESLTAKLRVKNSTDIEALLDEAENVKGGRVTDDTNREYRWRAMKGEELKILAANPLFDFGGHSVAHDDYIHLSTEQIVEDVLDNKTYIQQSTGRQVEYFAYTFGSYNANVNPQLHNRFGFYNDRSWIEQLHQMNKFFHEK
jgi:peptidoglycan/xylan/chitin deacetylase (PgdA/CDA1 family)